MVEVYAKRVHGKVKNKHLCVLPSKSLFRSTPLKRMSVDHVRCYSTDRNFSGNSVDPDQILHYAPSDLGQHSMSIVPLKRMTADHVRRYSTDRNFSGNSVDPDETLHYAPFDLGQHSFPGYPYRDTSLTMGYDGARGADNKIHKHVGHGRMIYYYFFLF